jgi:hypothetical protein
VLPRKYPVGDGSSLLAGKTDTPILNLDNAYGTWSFQQDPVTAALRGMGVRADRYRTLAALNEGHHIGGRELTGDRPARQSNYVPNLEEYGIVDSLRAWYRIFIQSSHGGTNPAWDESDAQLGTNWASTPENGGGGDRCIFFSGDDAFNALVNPNKVPFVVSYLRQHPGVAGTSQLGTGAENRLVHERRTARMFRSARSGLG